MLRTSGDRALSRAMERNGGGGGTRWENVPGPKEGQGPQFVVVVLCFFYIYQFIIKDIITDADGQPDEEGHGARLGKGQETLTPSCLPSPSTPTCSPPELPTAFLVSMEGSLLRSD